jgi:hypothetical protein
VVHRLLKNEVVASTGIEAYALLSKQCVDAMDVDVAALGLLPATETYEHIGTVQIWVHDLQRRWEQEESRTRVIVAEGEAAYRFDTPTAAPPQVTWEFVTTPRRRVGWQAGVTAVEVAATGNRRGAGATNHCMHGADASMEEILDWRPYDYYTYLNTTHTPNGAVRFLATTELEPTPDGGTILHQRFAAPETAKERAIMEQMASWIQDAMQTSLAVLSEQLAAEVEHREPDPTTESASRLREMGG